MCIEKILELKSPSLLIIEDRDSKDIVVGVPHHAPAGTNKLPCPEHRDSDENAGFLGRYIAKKLNCCSIIACNYRIDVNKCLQSDYSIQIAKWNPKALVEIHGHGGTKTETDIEISSGSSENDEYTKKLSEKLLEKFSQETELKSITTCGEYNKIILKASKSVTIKDCSWLSFHIELSPKLRKPTNTNSVKPPQLSYEFCDCLINSLNEMLRNNGQ